jgi:hypothetical protein
MQAGHLRLPGMPRDCELYRLVRLFRRRDERPPRACGHAQRPSVAVLGVSHEDGADSAGDFYALAAVRT